MIQSIFICICKRTPEPKSHELQHKTFNNLITWKDLQHSLGPFGTKGSFSSIVRFVRRNNKIKENVIMKCERQGVT